MAFGTQYIKASQLAQDRALSDQDDAVERSERSAAGQNAEPAGAPAAPESSPAAPPARRRQGLTPMPVTAPAPSPVASSAPETPAAPAGRRRFGPPEGYQASPSNAGGGAQKYQQLRAELSGSAQRDLTQRLNWLLESYATLRGCTREEISDLRRQAVADPQGMDRHLTEVYRTEIEEREKDSLRSMEDAIAQNPDSIVSVFVREGMRQVKVWPAGDNGRSLLHGTVVETIHASRTPFEPPHVRFPVAPVEVAHEATATAFSRPRP